MEKESFEKLLLKTAFCCMASDGHLDNREVALIKSICEKSDFYNRLNLSEEINALVAGINANGKLFIQQYLDLLKESELSDDEQLSLIGIAVQTIHADEQVQYSEIKFFKNIRHRLEISDDVILVRFPDIENFLQEDIRSHVLLERVTSNYFDTTELPQFEDITFEKE
jgi:uncharacterized tellurite resistance protein B-like protein